MAKAVKSIGEKGIEATARSTVEIEIARIKAPRRHKKSKTNEVQRKTDLRVLRTQKRFTLALEELLNEKPFEDISVSDICDRAGMKRTTFYKYYKDKNDHLMSYARTLSERLHSEIVNGGMTEHTSDYYAEYSRKLVGFCSKNARIFENILECSALPIVMKVLAKEIYFGTYNHIVESERMGMKLSASPEVLAATCVGTCTAAIYLWLSMGKNKSTDELADEIFRIVKRSVEG